MLSAKSYRQENWICFWSATQRNEKCGVYVYIGSCCFVWKHIVASCCDRQTEIAVKKGKGVPLQARSGPEGSRKLSFPDFMTVAQDRGKVVSLTHRPPLPPGNTPDTHFC
jgi:hypothetical protein